MGYSGDCNATLSVFDSVKQLFKIISIYQRASGAKVNLLKTNGFLMGKLRYNKDTPLDIRWNNEKIKILGFTFGNVDVSADNWEPVAFGIYETFWNCRKNMLKKLIKLFSNLFGAIENILYQRNKFNYLRS